MTTVERNLGGGGVEDEEEEVVRRFPGSRGILIWGKKGRKFGGGGAILIAQKGWWLKTVEKRNLLEGKLGILMVEGKYCSNLTGSNEGEREEMEVAWPEKVGPS